VTSRESRGGAVHDVLQRAADVAAFEAWRARGQATGWCRNPIRLVGASEHVATATGEVIATFASTGLPDRVLLKACGHRRATRCPTCSATYQGDAFQLVAAGLRGGKGAPSSVAEHPLAFVTFTAPSFGAVHSTRQTLGASRPCHPAGAANCPHGRPEICLAVHDAGDPALGQPICPDCFDYCGAVMWNANAGELWRRTTIALRRSLAHLAGIPRGALKDEVRVSFTKVVEYQRRGVVHLHAVIRLDAADDRTLPPPPPFDVGLLTAAINRASTATTVPYPNSSGLVGPARWGSQIDVHAIGDAGAVPGAVAAYLAKYATKSTDPEGLLDRPVTEPSLELLEQRLSAHLARLVRTAWELGGRTELQHLRLRPWAHTLGFRGHWLTKSRAYSTTFAALRSARHDWQTNRHRSTPSSDETVAIGAWKFAGRGWTTVGDAWLAETAAAATADTRRIVAAERRAEREKRHEP
jgi:hypothetical protein